MIVELDHEPTQACEVGPTLTNYRNITGCHCDERASRCRRGEQRTPECISDFRQDFCNPDRLMCGAPQRFIGSLAQLRIRLRVPNGHSCPRPQKAVEITPSLAKRRELETPNRALATLRRSHWHAKFTAASSAACQSYASSGTRGHLSATSRPLHPQARAPNLQAMACSNYRCVLIVMLIDFWCTAKLPATTSGLRWKVLDKKTRAAGSALYPKPAATQIGRGLRSVAALRRQKVRA